MKFIGLVSGGKDSIYSILQAIDQGHELACCAHLAPPRHDAREESYMYQAAGSEAVVLQVEGCMGVPCYVREIRGRSEDTALVYGAREDDDGGGGEDEAAADEVEDLFALLRDVARAHPDAAGVSSGAILSTYQRTRVEHVCARLGLASLAFMWRLSSQRALVDAILDDEGGVDAVLVRVACPPGLRPRRHLGRSLRELRDGGTLDVLRERWGMHPAGEGGEYETLVVDCPRVFKYGRLVLDETEIVEDESDDGVGVLRITKCTVEKKRIAQAEGDVACSRVMRVGPREKENGSAAQVREAIDASAEADRTPLALDVTTRIPQAMHLPNVRMMKGGLCHVSALLSPTAGSRHRGEAVAAVQEFISLRQMLHTILSRLFSNDQPRTSPRDVLYVHLYLSRMSHFADINRHYQHFFGTHLPPSRSCVAVGEGALPGGRRVMMDCVLQRGSGGYLRHTGDDDDGAACDTFLQKARRNRGAALRRTLHVQSISHWAPVCIGPYAQANALRAALVFLAGAIGLDPPRMTLVAGGWKAQLRQSWRNAAAVLDGVEDGGGVLGDAIGGLVYLSAGAWQATVTGGAAAPWAGLWAAARRVCVAALADNAGVVAGLVDGRVAADASNGGYEDEETRRACEAPSPPPPSEGLSVPLLMVCVPELPANAEAEVELVCASRRAVDCLGVRNGSLARSVLPSSERELYPTPLQQAILWDTGYDHVQPTIASSRDQRMSSCIEISSVSRFVGLGCASVCTSIASWKPGNGSQLVDNGAEIDVGAIPIEDILGRMIDLSINDANSRDGIGPSLFTMEDVLNVRLYYKAASASLRSIDDDSSILPSIELEMVDDGSVLRTQLHSVLQWKSRLDLETANVDRRTGPVNIPAYTAVPVLGMFLSHTEEALIEENGTPLMAMQVTLTDMPRMESEIWARHNRNYVHDN